MLNKCDVRFSHKQPTRRYSPEVTQTDLFIQSKFQQISTMQVKESIILVF